MSSMRTRGASWVYDSGRAITSANLDQGYDPKALAGLVFLDRADS